VDGQEKALRCYTTVLGLVKGEDIPTGPIPLVDREFAGRRARCGTGSGADPVFRRRRLIKKRRLTLASRPLLSWSQDIQAEFARRKERGAKFHGEPKSLDQLFL
jgi:hypothetical protein